MSEETGFCEICGERIFFARRIEGWTMHPVAPDGTVDFLTESETFDGKVWENFYCSSKDVPHNLPPRQIRLLKRVYESQYDELLAEVKEITEKDFASIEDYIDPFRWLQKGIR
jgi:hypothetical protein